MDTVNIIEYAKQLLAAHGDHAEAEAAQKAAGFEKQGDNEQAETWRRVRNAIKEMRASNVS